MLPAMSIRASAKMNMSLMIASAILLAGGALYLAITRGDPLSPLFRHGRTIEIIAVLLLWSMAALAVRRFTVGRLPELQLNLPGVIWGGSRVALLIATVLLMVGWLAALAFGLTVQVAFLRAVVLLLVVTFFTGIAGKAIINSLLAIRHWRGGTPE
ncbi:MAG TPA: hypothetical protein VF582_01995 [Allosphingosinicella sp.]|jgi:hypothetical protein